MQAYTNLRAYDWDTWVMGAVRSFISGGASAFGSGVSDVLLDMQHAVAAGGLAHVLKLMVCTFIVTGLVSMAVFLQTHGAPDQIQHTLQTAADATAKAGEAIHDAQSQASTKP